tara:strand:+ start:5858 stop:6304 length:447 start_codon:yes stop_codon:yes gene_type:complete
MALIDLIRTRSRRILQLEGGPGNNQPARASDVNPVITWINNRSDTNTVANAATATGTTTANTVTLNTISGTITTTSLTGLVDTATAITVTNAYCTTSSTVLVQISGGTYTTGTPVVSAVVPSSGSFVINLQNVLGTMNGTVIVKFIIL